MSPSEPPLTETAPPAPPEPLATKVARARDAQEAWGHTPFGDRVGCLLGAAKDMLRRRAEAMALVEEEIGKVHAEALFTEALGPLDAVKGWAKVLGPALSRRRVALNPLGFPGKRAFVEAVPRGVVAIIAPWNFPVAGLYRSVLPALLSGNAIVLKPSEHSPRSSGWLAARLAAYLPPGVVQIAPGDGAVGAALLDARPDACVFTGSTTTGRRVAIRCAELGIPCSAEMGGKDPAIVLADCDLDRTVAGITHWALCNAGQACGAIELVYAERGIADRLVERLRDVWTQLRVGPAHGTGADVAPLANARQLEVVSRHVADARAQGATVVCGGAPLGEGLSFAPTVLDHCTDAMAVVREETFGPVLAVCRVDGPAEAIRAANRLALSAPEFQP
jgi:acyl-CoA reductase-like NAD-dependent aldehyde dehydrogenase